MKAVSRIFIYGAIFISLCSVALCMETSLLLHLPFNSFYFYLTVFSATLGQYNIHYYIKRDGDSSSDRFLWSISHKKIHLILNIVGAIGLTIGFLGLQPRKYVVLAVIAAITVLYSFPFLPLKHKKRLKDFGLLKILTLAFVWTLITVWFPVVNYSPINTEVQLVFVHRFVFMFILCLPFDIRDMASDKREGISTIPNVIGEKKSYQLTLLSLLLFALLSYLLFYLNPQFWIFIAMLISGLGTYFAVFYKKENKTDWYYLTAVDGMMMLQAVLVGWAVLMNTTIF